MRKLILLLLTIPIATNADFIEFDFVGLNGDDGWTMHGSILIDEANVIAGVNLVPFFYSWEFSWTDGTDTYGTSSLTKSFLPSVPISGTPITFFVDAAGSVVSSFLCSDVCAVDNHPEFNVSVTDYSVGWQATLPIPEYPGYYTFVTGRSAAYTNQGPVSVTEPGTLALLGIGLVGMGLARRRTYA